ncbi:hypothetical protein P8452_15508 [Trifolium repens]|nr:hypothetical protein P8452_15508 [Trifolium repens]
MEEEQHEEELQEQHDEEPYESQHDEEVEEQDEAAEEEEGYENENDEVYDEEEQRSSPPPSPPKRKTRRRKPPTTKGRQNPPEDAPPGGYGGGPTDLSLLPNFGKHIAAALWKGKYPERYLRQASGNNGGYNCLLQAWIMVHFPRFGAKYVDRKYDHRNPVAAKFYCMKAGAFTDVVSGYAINRNSSLICNFMSWFANLNRS